MRNVLWRKVISKLEGASRMLVRLQSAMNKEQRPISASELKLYRAYVKFHQSLLNEFFWTSATASILEEAID